MRPHPEINRKRIFAVALLVAFLAAAWLSEAYAAAHLRHRCAGENCPVCARLEACLQTAELTGLTVCGAGIFSAESLLRPATAILPGFAALLPPASLLLLKIRLNN